MLRRLDAFQGQAQFRCLDALDALDALDVSGALGAFKIRRLDA